MTKLKVGIIGSGNIGTDLMYKIERSPVLEMSVMVGIDPNSDGLKRAKNRGYEIISNGIDGLMERTELVDIVYDATSAYAHKHNSDLLTAANKKVIDLTPAAIGQFTVPPDKFKRAYRKIKCEYGYVWWSGNDSNHSCNQSYCACRIC